MDIVHGKPGVPRHVSLLLLTALSVLVDKYQLLKVVSKYSDQWVDALKRDIPQTITSDLFHWLSVSWVFRSSEEFNHLTRILERESDGLDLDTYSNELHEYLPIPEIITGTSTTNKRLSQLLTSHRDYSAQKTESNLPSVRHAKLLDRHPPNAKNTLQCQRFTRVAPPHLRCKAPRFSLGQRYENRDMASPTSSLQRSDIQRHRIRHQSAGCCIIL
jgi:hypothetical protein